MSLYQQNYNLNDDIASQMSEQDWVIDPLATRMSGGEPVWIKKYGPRWKKLYAMSVTAEDRFDMQPSWTSDLLGDKAVSSSSSLLVPNTDESSQLFNHENTMGAPTNGPRKTTVRL